MNKFWFAVVPFLLTGVQAAAEEFKCYNYEKDHSSVYLNPRESCWPGGGFGGETTCALTGLEIVPLNEKVSDHAARLPKKGNVCIKGSILRGSTGFSEKILTYDIQ